jgi:DNA repair protein RecO (recombination protein O)
MTISADRAERQLSYVLHSRPYRETSALVDYFSRDAGVVRAVAKGVRSAKSRQRHLTQPFQCLELNWRGQGELKTLLGGDMTEHSVMLQGRNLWCGLYLNELTLRLVPQGESFPKLFAYYQLALERLSNPLEQEMVLRIYERQLLQQLGLGVDFYRTPTGTLISTEQHYRLDPQQGFVLNGLDPQTAAGRFDYPGGLILAIAADDYQRDSVRRAAKRLMRQLLAVHLGHRPLHSRELFQGSGAVRYQSAQGDSS